MFNMDYTPLANKIQHLLSVTPIPLRKTQMAEACGTTINAVNHALDILDRQGKIREIKGPYQRWPKYVTR